MGIGDIVFWIDTHFNFQSGIVKEVKNENTENEMYYIKKKNGRLMYCGLENLGISIEHLRDKLFDKIEAKANIAKETCIETNEGLY